jgi:hypothetical protein
MTDFTKLRIMTPEEVAAIPPEQPDPEYIRRNTELKTVTIYERIAERRQKQIAKGYDAAHDDQHANGEIAMSAAAYCQSAAKPKLYQKKPGAAFTFPMCWPWKPAEFNPKNSKEDLIDAAAMIVAEYERLERLELGQ